MCSVSMSAIRVWCMVYYTSWLLVVLLCDDASSFGVKSGLFNQKRVPSSSSSSRLFSSTPKKVFIDGSAGTTGLQVRDRLRDRVDIEVLSLPDESRKDVSLRRAMINSADCVVLCLPDDASIEAVSLVDESNTHTVIIDASTAFRVDEGWTWGFPELNVEQRRAIVQSKRISNPGCYPTGFVGLMGPLVTAGLVPKDTYVTVNAISGYSGGGKQLMEIYEQEQNDQVEPWGAYGFSLSHKHLPEMTKYAGLNHKPVFQPQVASFSQGMVVSVPLHYAWLDHDDTTTTIGERMHTILSRHYADSLFVDVVDTTDTATSSDFLERGAFLRPDTLRDTNRMQLFVFDNPQNQQVLLCARLDNLGKGASGAAVQNMNLALGLDETKGLL